MTKTTIAEDAVVLGASIAGLLAARVLADAYARVTGIERDYLPHDPGSPPGGAARPSPPRPAASGPAAARRAVPGFTKQMVRAGAGIGDHLGGVRWQLSGQRLRQVDIGRSSLAASRPLLEGQVRRRVKALPSVGFIEGSNPRPPRTSGESPR